MDEQSLSVNKNFNSKSLTLDGDCLKSSEIDLITQSFADKKECKNLPRHLVPTQFCQTIHKSCHFKIW